MRANIDIDEELLRKLMKVSGIKTRKAVIDHALRMMLRLQNQKRAFDDMKGIGWEGDLEEMRLGWHSPDRQL